MIITKRSTDEEFVAKAVELANRLDEAIRRLGKVNRGSVLTYVAVRFTNHGTVHVGLAGFNLANTTGEGDVCLGSVERTAADAVALIGKVVLAVSGRNSAPSTSS